MKKIEVNKDNIQNVLLHSKYVYIKKDKEVIKSIELGSINGNIKITYGENNNIVFNYLTDNIIYIYDEKSIKNLSSDNSRFGRTSNQGNEEELRKIPGLSLRKNEIVDESLEKEEEKKELIMSDVFKKIIVYGLKDYIIELKPDIIEIINKDEKNLFEKNPQKIVDNVYQFLVTCCDTMKLLNNIINEENIKINDDEKFSVLEKIGFKYFEDTTYLELLNNKNEKIYSKDFNKKLDNIYRSLRTWQHIIDYVKKENSYKEYYDYMTDKIEKKNIKSSNKCINYRMNFITSILISLKDDVKNFKSDNNNNNFNIIINQDNDKKIENNKKENDEDNEKEILFKKKLILEKKEEIQNIIKKIEREMKIENKFELDQLKVNLLNLIIQKLCKLKKIEQITYELFIKEVHRDLSIMSDENKKKIFLDNFENLYNNFNESGNGSGLKNKYFIDNKIKEIVYKKYCL